jgi:putative DNA primase/helicase
MAGDGDVARQEWAEGQGTEEQRDIARLITKEIRDCVEGRSKVSPALLKARHRALCKAYDLSVEYVDWLWDQADQDVAKAAGEQKGNKPDAFEGFRAWLNEQGRPKVEVRAEPKIEPEPEPRVEPKPAAGAETGRAEEMPKPTPEAEPAAKVDDPGVETGTGSAQPQGETEGDAKPTAEPLFLRADTPQLTARAFIREECSKDGRPILVRHQEEYFRWNGTFYERLSDEKMQGSMAGFMGRAWKHAAHGKKEQNQPRKAQVEEALYFVRNESVLDDKLQPPMWLDTQKPAPDWITFRNGIVNVLTGEVRPLTPLFWAHSAADYDWDPNARCPVWDGTREDLFPGDDEAQQLLEEYIGYSMTEDIRFNKALMLIGVARSGKGTICRVQKMMVGPGSYFGTSLNKWMETAYSMEDIIGKRVVAFTDELVKEEHMYGKTLDMGGVDYKSQSMLLRITGGDDVAIGRKYVRGAWHGVLPTKITLVSNKILNLNNPVLQKRFLKLEHTRNFEEEGLIDLDLEDKLKGERSGMAARFVAAYRRLCERGEFIQPTSGLVLERELTKASDPFSVMAQDCFVAVPDMSQWTPKDDMYQVFNTWCKENNKMNLANTTRDNQFGGRLSALPNFKHIITTRPGGTWSWKGAGLTDKGKALLAQARAEKSGSLLDVRST